VYGHDMDVEFVKDSVEYVKFIGNFNTGQTNQLEVIPNDQSTHFPNCLMLGIIPYCEAPANINKVEIHYQNFRRFLFDGPPANLAVIPHYNLYSRETILADSIDIWMKCIQQDSTLDVNAQYLKVSGNLTKTKLSGHTDKLITDIQSWGNGPSYYNFGDLTTDSCFLTINGTGVAGTYHRADVYCNNYLEINVQSAIGSTSLCPLCIFEIYYKGYPTIANSDSLDSRIVIIDNN